MSENPLTEAHPLSLDALFSADPTTLTDEEVGTIVDELTRGRRRMVEAELAGKSTRSAATRAPKAAKGSLSLSDLGELEF